MEGRRWREGRRGGEGKSDGGKEGREKWRTDMWPRTTALEERH